MGEYKSARISTYHFVKKEEDAVHAVISVLSVTGEAPWLLVQKLLYGHSFFKVRTVGYRHCEL